MIIIIITLLSVNVFSTAVKNPNWWEAADQLAFYKRGLKLGVSVLQIQLVVRAGIEPGTSDSKSGVLTTWPRSLQINM